MKVRRVDFSPDEWIAGTIDLSLAERGMYITACSLIYSRGGAILTGMLRSFCHEDLRTYTRCLQKLLDLGKLELKEGYLSNKRCLSELQSAENRSVTAAENVAKRWSKSKKNNEVADTSVLPRGNANHQPSTTNHQLEESPNGDSPKTPSERSSDVAGEMTKIWNEECGSISRANKPNHTRTAKCALRWRDSFGRDAAQFRAYCQRVAAAPHLRGENDRGWRVDLDWVLSPSNLSRITEGRYDPRLVAPARRVPDGPPPIIEDEHGNRINPLDGSIVSEPGALPIDKKEAAGERVFSIH